MSKNKRKFTLSTGKDGKYEYVPVKVVKYLKETQEILDYYYENIIMRVIVHSPIEVNTVGTSLEISKEILRLSLIYGTIEYELEVVNK